ncbi:endolytic transglycosylase MltG [Psittacicella gerlachiana]|uniref:Endolytic murein transglycosylase n=1 Tax=Psittacicella gerlachiana TaxID=2028574 RepID=A0A3A1YNP7_9GAMM|nr:endolytic transglycosylase MltG [Psittacicella gerlachiana]RIY38859.1 hypothetical protein CKF59_00215 [Psittacicella gerlachiana]
MKKIIFGLFSLLILALACLYAGYNYVINLGKVRLINNATPFEVYRGDNLTRVINRLIGDENSLRVKFYIYLHPEFNNLKTSYYDLKEARNLHQALEIINSGKGITVSIRLIPGRTWQQWDSYLNTLDNSVNNDLQNLTPQQIAQKLGIKAIDGDKNFNSLEGYFSPNTFIINYRASLSSALKLSYQELEKNLHEAWKARNQYSQVKSPYELLILASIIEKEKGNDQEATLISSVFNNRLKIGMRLQADPTVIYGMGDKYKGNITRNDLNTPTPYNTYTINGLPPTPIAMVSKASLMAAAQPANTNYLYFMAVFGQSKHAFASTYAEHVKNVQKFNQEYRKTYGK